MTGSRLRFIHRANPIETIGLLLLIHGCGHRRLLPTLVDAFLSDGGNLLVGEIPWLAKLAPLLATVLVLVGASDLVDGVEQVLEQVFPLGFGHAEPRWLSTARRRNGHGEQDDDQDRGRKAAADVDHHLVLLFFGPACRPRDAPKTVARPAPVGRLGTHGGRSLRGRFHRGGTGGRSQVVEEAHVETARRRGRAGSRARLPGCRLRPVGGHRESAFALRTDQCPAFELISHGQLLVTIRTWNDLTHDITCAWGGGVEFTRTSGPAADTPE